MKNIRNLAWFNFFLDFRLYAPIAIIYFTHVSGSYALGASILSVVMLSSALFEIPTGDYSDRIGRKRTMMFGAICTVLAVTSYAIGSDDAEEPLSSIRPRMIAASAAAALLATALVITVDMVMYINLMNALVDIGERRDSIGRTDPWFGDVDLFSVP